MVQTGDVRVTHRVDHQPRYVDGLTDQRPAGVQPRQQQEVLDETGHARGLGLHPAHRVRGVVRQIAALALHQFGVPADGRQRSAQFVAGIGDELPDPRLAGVARREGAGHPIEHRVQRRPELTDLGVGGHRIDR